MYMYIYIHTYIYIYIYIYMYVYIYIYIYVYVCVYIYIYITCMFLAQDEPEDEEAERGRDGGAEHRAEADADPRHRRDGAQATRDPGSRTGDAPPGEAEPGLVACKQTLEDEEAAHDEDPERLVALEDDGVGARLQHLRRLDGHRVGAHEDAAEERKQQRRVHDGQLPRRRLRRRAPRSARGPQNPPGTGRSEMMRRRRDYLGASLGRSWGHLGTILGHLGVILGPSWGHHRGHLGPSWAIVGSSWGHLGVIVGVILGQSWVILG